MMACFSLNEDARGKDGKYKGIFHMKKKGKEINTAKRIRLFAGRRVFFDGIGTRQESPRLVKLKTVKTWLNDVGRMIDIWWRKIFKTGMLIYP